MKVLTYDSNQTFDYENGYYLTCDNKRIPKVLAQYEIYKLILNIPGTIVECGVFKGASLLRLAHFRECLENPVARKIVGFDAFGEFPRNTVKEDNDFAQQHDQGTGLGIGRDDLARVFEFKGLKNIELVAGDLLQTLPQYVQKHTEMRIALLHIDVDVYVPTKMALEVLFDRVMRGGVIVFDDYSHIAGETRAVDEFLANKKLSIKKFPFAHSPSYIVKE